MSTLQITINIGNLTFKAFLYILLNIITNNDLYRKLPKQRRLRLTGHCIHHPEEIVSELVRWEPTRGKASRDRRAVTFTDTLLKDTELQTTRELKTVMKHRALAWICRR